MTNELRTAPATRVWLASYPRSGNTFLRMILRQAFGVPSTSVYASEDDAMLSRQWLSERIGHVGPFVDVSDVQGWLGVKTHDPPQNDGPAIYVVRDGRAALASYRQMLVDYASMDTTFEDLIEGRVWPGSWSAHYDAWSPETRANTLFLRYEEMLSDVGAVCSKISMFLEIPQIAPFTQSFAELNSVEPTHFRRADNASGIAELSAHQRRFIGAHGELMSRLGYL